MPATSLGIAWSLATASLLGAYGASPAHAAETETSTALAEVVVTAQRREEDIRDVPMSISAISATDLANRGDVTFKDYAVTVPSVSFGFKGGEARGSGNTIAIRGVSGTNTTGYYVDDTPIPTGVDPHLIGVERIEILRGPQGTLYGSGSMGGTIKLVSVQPAPEEFDGVVQVTLSDTDEAGDPNYSLDGSVNLPLGDKSALLISGYIDNRGGVFDRIYGEPLPYYPEGVVIGETGRNENVDDSSIYGGRISLLWAPTDNVTITPTIYYQDTTVDGIFAADADTDEFDQYRAYDFEEPFDEEYYLANLTMKFAFGWAELTSSTSYLDREFGEIEDNTEIIDLFLRGAYGNPEAAMFPALTNNDRHHDRFTQEFRLAGQAGSVRWLVGAFYQETDVTRDALILMEGMSTDPDYADFGGDLGFISRDGTSAEEKALFTDLSWAITEKFEASAGVRYFDNSIEGFRQSGGFLDAEVNLGPDDLNQSENGFTPRFAAKYQAGADTMLYASAAKGFRGGGFSIPLPDYCDDDLIDVGFLGQPGSFDSDSLWSYEAGVKTAWFGNRVNLDLAVFQIDWTEIQQQIRLECGWGFNANLGEAEIQGFELEARALPADGLELGLGVSLNDSEITDPGVNTPAHAGDQLLDTPKWKVYLNVQYTFPLFNDTEMYLRADYQYNDDSFSTFNQDNSPTGEPYLPREAFDVVDFRAAVRWLNSDLELAAFVQNAFNEHANFGPYQSIGVDFPGRPRLATNWPRTIGLSLRKRF